MRCSPVWCDEASIPATFEPLSGPHATTPHPTGLLPTLFPLLRYSSLLFHSSTSLCLQISARGSFISPSCLGLSFPTRHVIISLFECAMSVRPYHYCCHSHKTLSSEKTRAIAPHIDHCAPESWLLTLTTMRPESSMGMPGI